MGLGNVEGYQPMCDIYLTTLWPARYLWRTYSADLYRPAFT